MVQASAFQPPFHQRSSSSHSYSATHALNQPNCQLVFPQGNRRSFHFYSIWTLHWYYQLLAINALTEGLLTLKNKLFSKPHTMQLPRSSGALPGTVVSTTVVSYTDILRTEEWSRHSAQLNSMSHRMIDGFLRAKRPIKNSRGTSAAIGVTAGCGLLQLQSQHGALQYWFANKKRL